MSVDDLVADIFELLHRKGVLDNTYVLLTSDHGYALGQQARPSGKFNVHLGHCLELHCDRTTRLYQ